MERLNFKRIFVWLYVFAFGVYLVIGLQPVNATEEGSLSRLDIPSIDLVSSVVRAGLVDGELEVPDAIVGEYSINENKTFLFGHSTTVFANLNKVELLDKINYMGKTYKVYQKDMVPKSKVDMGQILKAEEKDILVVMTCAGVLLERGDATHRLIVYASI